MGDLPRTMREIHEAHTDRLSRRIRPGENWNDYLRRREAEALAKAYGDITASIDTKADREGEG